MRASARAAKHRQAAVNIPSNMPSGVVFQTRRSADLEPDDYLPESRDVAVSFEEMDQQIAENDKRARESLRCMSSGWCEDPARATTSPDALDIDVALRAWPESMMGFLVQVATEKASSFERPALAQFETWTRLAEETLLATRSADAAKTSATMEADVMQREVTSALAAMGGRSETHRVVAQDFTQCMARLQKSAVELADETLNVRTAWFAARVDLVEQTKAFLSTLATQNKVNLSQLDARSQRQKLQAAPQPTQDDWRKTLRGVVEGVLLPAIRTRILPVLLDKNLKDQLTTYVSQFDFANIGLSCTGLMQIFGVALRRDAMAAKTAAAQFQQCLPDVRSAEWYRNSLVQAQAQAVRQLCHSALMIRDHAQAMDLLFQATCKICALAEEAESVEATVTAFRDTEYTRSRDAIHSFFAKSATDTFHAAVARLRQLDQAFENNERLHTLQQQVRMCQDAWSQLRSGSAMEIAEHAALLTRWHQAATQAHSLCLESAGLACQSRAIEQVKNFLEHET